MPATVDSAIDELYRADWGRIVATLIRLVGDFDVAEDAAQEAFAAAAEQWPATGVPEFPRAWIIQTARNKAIDRIRRRVRLEQKLDTYTTARRRAHGHLPRVQRRVQRCEARALRRGHPPRAPRARADRAAAPGRDRAPRSHAAPRRPARGPA